MGGFSGAGHYPAFSRPLLSSGRGDDTVGKPHRAQIVQFELFEFILLLELDEQFPVEQSEARVSQSTVPFPAPSCLAGRALAPEELGGALNALNARNAIPTQSCSFV